MRLLKLYLFIVSWCSFTACCQSVDWYQKLPDKLKTTKGVFKLIQDCGKQEYGLLLGGTYRFARYQNKDDKSICEVTLEPRKGTHRFAFIYGDSKKVIQYNADQVPDTLDITIFDKSRLVLAHRNEYFDHNQDDNQN